MVDLGNACFTVSVKVIALFGGRSSDKVLFVKTHLSAFYMNIQRDCVEFLKVTRV